MKNMVVGLSVGLLIGWLFPGWIGAQIPSTDISVVTLVSGEGNQGSAVAPGDPIRVTNRAEYDNQPMFLPGDTVLAYTAIQEDGKMNILGYEFSSGRSLALISSPESEYSATPVPGEDSISVIREYEPMPNGLPHQELWSFPIRGGEPRNLLPDMTLIGYHAWASEEKLLLFVLGPDSTTPMTLQIATVGSSSGKVVAQNPGRGLAKIPGTDLMSFVQKGDEGDWLCSIDVESGEIVRLLAMPPNREDYAWAQDGSVWVADGSRLFRATPSSEGGGNAQWSLAADLKDQGIDGISRMAFDSQGRQLALVHTR